MPNATVLFLKKSNRTIKNAPKKTGLEQLYFFQKKCYRWCSMMIFYTHNGATEYNYHVKNEKNQTISRYPKMASYGQKWPKLMFLGLKS